MTLDEAFQVLGLELTANREAVQRAYLRLLRRHNPERDRAGFLRLREALELARPHASANEVVPPAEAPATPGSAGGSPGSPDFEASWRDAWTAHARGELQPAARTVQRLLGEAAALQLEVPPRLLLGFLLDLYEAGFSEEANHLFTAATRWMERTGRRPEEGTEISWRICDELGRVDPLRLPFAVRKLIAGAARAGGPARVQVALNDFGRREPAAAREALSELARGAPGLLALFGPFLSAPPPGQAQPPQDVASTKRKRGDGAECWARAHDRLRAGDLAQGALLMARALAEETGHRRSPVNPRYVLYVLFELHRAHRSTDAGALHHALCGWLYRTGETPFQSEPYRRQWSYANELAQLDPLRFPAALRSAIARALDDSGKVDPVPVRAAWRELQGADPVAAREARSDLERVAPTLKALFGDLLSTETETAQAPPLEVQMDPRRRQAAERWARVEAWVREDNSVQAALVMIRALREHEDDAASPVRPELVLAVVLTLHRERRATSAVELQASLVAWLERMKKAPFEEEPLRHRWTCARELARLDPLRFPVEVRSAIAGALDAPRDAFARLRAFAAANPAQAELAWRMLALEATTLFEAFERPLDVVEEDGAGTDETGAQQHWERAEQLFADRQWASAGQAAISALAARHTPALEVDPSRLVDHLLAVVRAAHELAAKMRDAIQRWAFRTGQEAALARSGRWQGAQELCGHDPPGFPPTIRVALAEALLQPTREASEAVVRTAASQGPLAAAVALEILTNRQGVLLRRFGDVLASGAGLPAPKIKRRLRRLWAAAGLVAAVAIASLVGWETSHDAPIRIGPAPGLEARAASAELCRYAQEREEGPAARACDLAAMVARALAAGDCETARLSIRDLDALGLPPGRAVDCLERLRRLHASACPGVVR